MVYDAVMIRQNKPVNPLAEANGNESRTNFNNKFCSAFIAVTFM